MSQKNDNPVSIPEAYPESPVFLTPDEIARIARVTPATVHNHIKEEKLKARKIGRNYRILECDAREYLGLPPDVKIVIPPPPVDPDNSSAASGAP